VAGYAGPRGVCALKMVKLAAVLCSAACVLVAATRSDRPVHRVRGTSLPTRAAARRCSWQAPTTNTDGAGGSPTSRATAFTTQNADDLTQTASHERRPPEYVIDDLGSGTCTSHQAPVYPAQRRDTRTTSWPVRIVLMTNRTNT